MRVAVTGAGGLIGTALRRALERAGHSALPITRATPARPGTIAWNPVAGRLDPTDLAGLDAVVHLAGAGIGDKRWTPERKRVVLESRTRGTALLAATLAEMTDPPAVLLSASAIGYYGSRGDDVLTETSAPGSGFLPDLCVAWERATQAASGAGIRTVHLRTGLVQARSGGALGKSLPLFKLGLGGRFGSGGQWWSWISIDDEVGAILHLLGSDVAGPVNLTAPNPVTNTEYTKALGRAVHRPARLPVPMAGPRLHLGRELADTLLLDSARVLPTVLEASGYEFRHRTIEACLQHVLSDRQ